MKKLYLLSLMLVLGLFGYSQGQMFTFDFGSKFFSNQSNNGHKTAGLEYTVAGSYVGLALRGDFILRGGDPHVGGGASGRVYFSGDGPSGLYLGAGVDALLTDGRQIMPRGDIGYNLVFERLVIALEFVSGYDLGYSRSGSNSATSYFGGPFYGGEFKVGWAF